MAKRYLWQRARVQANRLRRRRIAKRADASYADDLARLDLMTPAQIDYLARVGELPDPYTDGLDCDGGHG